MIEFIVLRNHILTHTLRELLTRLPLAMAASLSSTWLQSAPDLSSCLAFKNSSSPSAQWASLAPPPAQRIHTPWKIVAMAPPKASGKARKVVAVVKLALEAGKATPAPPVGPALGSKGVNIMAFCKEYNAKTADKAGYVIPVEITVFDDRSFTFVLKTPPASILLLKAAGAERGSNDPKKLMVGKVTTEQVRAIATEKLPDLNCSSVESAMRTIAGTAANMGIEIDPPILQPKKRVVVL